MLKITKIQRNSIAKELGLEVGDEIVAFDGHPCEDELDYLYYCETDAFTKYSSAGCKKFTPNS